MIELIEGLPDHVVAFTASGQVSGDDYQNVLIPAVEQKFGKYERIRLLYHLGTDFKKFTTTALWDDTKIGLHHLTGFERVAIVSDIDWINNMAKGVALVIPTELRVFKHGELDDAKAWISE
jgi:hypothetical protein